MAGQLQAGCYLLLTDFRHKQATGNSILKSNLPSPNSILSRDSSIVQNCTTKEQQQLLENHQILIITASRDYINASKRAKWTRQMHAGCIGRNLQKGQPQAVVHPDLQARVPCALGGGLEAAGRDCLPQRGAQLQQGPNHLYSGPEPVRDSRVTQSKAVTVHTDQVLRPPRKCSLCSL